MDLNNQNNKQPDELIVEALLREYTPKEAQKQLSLMAGYIDTPPTITEFIDDPYFAGKFLGDKFYPAWRQTLQQIFPNPFYSPFITVALTGSTRYGKTTATLAGMIYDLTKLLYLKSPHEKFGIIDTTEIVIAFINTTKTLSQSVLYTQFKEMLEMSPFFSDQRKGLGKREFLPHRIAPMHGSQSEHYLGTGVVMAVLSELNFQKRLRDQAVNNFTAMKTRMEGTYGRGDQYISPGRLWMDSSKTDQDGFMEGQLVRLKGDPKAIVVEKALWEVLPPWKRKYSDIKFKVFIGSPTRDPFILDGPGSAINVPESLIIEVPEDYRPEFEANIYGALRDLAGKSTWSTHKFFQNIQPVKSSLRLKNCTHKEIIDLDFDNDDRLIDFIDLERFDKQSLYFFHLDIGIKFDRTGLAATKTNGTTMVERRDNKTGLSLVYDDFIYQTDLAVGIIPRPNKQVPIYKLKNFFVDLRNANYRIGGISLDGYQSVNMIQDLTLLGFPTEKISVDTSREPYDAFHTTVTEGRWMGPAYKLLEDELTGLLDMTTKIDHPFSDTKLGQVNEDRPSKDVADAVCGSHWNCKQKGTIGVMNMNSLEAYVDYAEKQQMQPRTVRDQIEDQWKRNQRFNEF